MTTAIDERLALLRRSAGEWTGPWTTRRVQHLYQAAFGPGDWRRKARADLDLLAQQGLLVLNDQDPDRRFYTLNRITTGDA